MIKPMKMSKSFLLAMLVILGYSNKSSAQYGFSHEVGIIVGPVAFQSDYGVRQDFSTNAGNVGFGIGLIHYLNFSYTAECNCYNPQTYFNDHFKLRTEISYNKTQLKHYGEYVAPEKTSIFAQQLRAMRGSTSVTNIGMQLEYFPFSIRDFTATIGKLGPFVSFGGQFSFYSPTSYSTINRNSNLGVEDNVTPVKYKNAFDRQGGTVFSVVGSVGTRYRLNNVSDLMVDLRWQYYFSNWVDGLNPNPQIYTENRSNDWLIWFNVGYIYYLN